MKLLYGRNTTLFFSPTSYIVAVTSNFQTSFLNLQWQFPSGNAERWRYYSIRKLAKKEFRLFLVSVYRKRTKPKANDILAQKNSSKINSEQVMTKEVSNVGRRDFVSALLH